MSKKQLVCDFWSIVKSNQQKITSLTHKIPINNKKKQVFICQFQAYCVQICINFYQTLVYYKRLQQKWHPNTLTKKHNPEEAAAHDASHFMHRERERVVGISQADRPGLE